MCTGDEASDGGGGPATRSGLNLAADVGRGDEQVAPVPSPRAAGASDPTGGVIGPTSPPASVGQPQICLYCVTGELDAGDLVRLHERCLAELDRGTTTMVLDFTRMTACPSALFSIVSDVGRSFRTRSAQLRLIGLADAVRAIALRR